MLSQRGVLTRMSLACSLELCGRVSRVAATSNKLKLKHCTWYCRSRLKLSSPHYTKGMKYPKQNESRLTDQGYRPVN